ncbi:MAG: NgoFVII family restriction endonuclease [Planctomycetota bacterium]|nr:NgoFVII family restriction endonuclease [Planctomycetota bacterium]
MQVLADREIEDALLDLMRRFDTYEWAVAWASLGCEAADLLAKQSSRIRRLVVGTHFHQTHPDFLDRFHREETARFVMSPRGIFHPKVYLFSKGATWEALIGSANFTRSAFEENQEVVVRVGNADDPAGTALEKLRSTIDAYWESGKRLTSAEVEGYRAIWERMAPMRDRLAGTYRSPRTNRPDGGRGVSETEIGLLAWPEFYRRVREDRYQSLAQRLGVIRAARTWFRETPHFCDMDEQTRKRIAGTTYEGKVPQDWLYFGSMKGAGVFKQLVIENSPELSLALDVLPLDGEVTRHEFDAFMDQFASAFEGKERGANGLATATRLLAMKRPDYFVCLDSKNRERLCAAFNISASIGREGYWDQLIARLQDCAWWTAQPPVGDQDERDVWHARAAFLDSLFFEE